MINEQKKGFMSTIFGIVTLAAVVVVICLMIVFMNSTKAANAKITKYVDDQIKAQAEELAKDSDYIEDGFLVGETYEIKSTKNISDAYLKNDPSGLTGTDKETYDMASAVLKEVIKDNMSTYEKEKAIYDWIVDNVETGESTALQMEGTSATDAVGTPYGVLKGKKAVCVGYATTFRLLVNMIGLDCHIVHNDYHSWDLVQLDDKGWYHVDCYSDSSSHNYSTFNLTDAMRAQDNEWAGRDTLPAADKIEYTYANQNAKDLDDINKIPKTIYKKSNGNTKSYSLYYNIKNADEEMMENVELMVNVMNEAFMSGEMPGFDSKYISYSWATGDNKAILCLYVTDANEQDLGSYDPEKVNDMYNLINEEFGTSLFTDGYVDDAGDVGTEYIEEEGMEPAA